MRMASQRGRRVPIGIAPLPFDHPHERGDAHREQRADVDQDDGVADGVQQPTSSTPRCPMASAKTIRRRGSVADRGSVTVGVAAASPRRRSRAQVLAREAGDVVVDRRRAPPARRGTRCGRSRRRAVPKPEPYTQRMPVARSRPSTKSSSVRPGGQRRPAASRRTRRAAPRSACPAMAFKRSVVSVARARAAPAGTTPGASDRRSAPRSTAYCIGPGLHSRPSASFLIAASAASRRGVAPTAIQPARQPGARYAFDRLE